MDVKFIVAGDRAVSVVFGEEINLEVNGRVRMLSDELENNPIKGITETVPTYVSLIVYYRPEIIRYEELVANLKTRIVDERAASTGKKIVKEIPILYGGEGGPDLEACAALENISPKEIIRMHSQHEYYVYMLGFAPGHPYMARFEEPFQFKRRETPRIKIPARSIVVQLNLSDLIPFEQPCGWNIIGMTPLEICDFSKEDPFLVHAGEWVKHVPITEKEYHSIRRGVERGAYQCKTYEKAVV